MASRTPKGKTAKAPRASSKKMKPASTTTETSAPATTGAASTPSKDSFRAKVRMYRHGLGDCFLITLPGKERPYYIVIDCGVILGTQNAGDIMNRVVQSIIDTTGGRVDIVAGTHEHWDHLSGLVRLAISGRRNSRSIRSGWPGPKTFR